MVHLDVGLRVMPDAMKVSRMSPSCRKEHSSNSRKEAPDYAQRAQYLSSIAPFDQRKQYIFSKINSLKGDVPAELQIPQENPAKMKYLGGGISPSMAGRMQNYNSERLLPMSKSHVPEQNC
jgi:hypothetical protein